MKKILFVIDTLGSGGAEKALLTIVSNLDKSKYDITVVALFNTGIYINKVKKFVKYKYCFKSFNLKESFMLRILCRIIFKLKLLFFNFPNIFIKEKYDIEVAFLEGSSTKFINKLNNKNSKKIAWVHTDVINNPRADQFFKNINEQKYCYSQYNKILCVSKIARDKFIEKFNIEDNVFVQYNLIDEKSIILMSNEQITDIEVTNKFKVISLGRLSKEKGYDRLLKVHNMLLNEGFDYELWILGEGSEKTKLEQFIKENNMNKYVKLLGFKENPYKYINVCDLFVCSSIAEGYNIAIAEALILSKPVLSTNCLGALELLEGGKYGLIVNNDIDDLYKGLKKLLIDKNMYNHYEKMAKERGNDFNLSIRMKEIENIFDN